MAPPKKRKFSRNQVTGQAQRHQRVPRPRPAPRASLAPVAPVAPVAPSANLAVDRTVNGSSVAPPTMAMPNFQDGYQSAPMPMIEGLQRPERPGPYAGSVLLGGGAPMMDDVSGVFPGPMQGAMSPWDAKTAGGIGDQAGQALGSIGGLYGQVPQAARQMRGRVHADSMSAIDRLRAASTGGAPVPISDGTEELFGRMQQKARQNAQDTFAPQWNQRMRNMQAMKVDPSTVGPGDDGMARAAEAYTARRGNMDGVMGALRGGGDMGQFVPQTPGAGGHAGALAAGLMQNQQRRDRMLGGYNVGGVGLGPATGAAPPARGDWSHLASEQRQAPVMQTGDDNFNARRAMLMGGALQPGKMTSGGSKYQARPDAEGGGVRLVQPPPGFDHDGANPLSWISPQAILSAEADNRANRVAGVGVSKLKHAEIVKNQDAWKEYRDSRKAKKAERTQTRMAGRAVGNPQIKAAYQARYGANPLTGKPIAGAGPAGEQPRAGQAQAAQIDALVAQRVKEAGNGNEYQASRDALLDVFEAGQLSGKELEARIEALGPMMNPLTQGVDPLEDFNKQAFDRANKKSRANLGRLRSRSRLNEGYKNYHR